MLVTQGTLANTDFRALIRPALDALAAEELLVVATTGGRPVSQLGPLPPALELQSSSPTTDSSR